MATDSWPSSLPDCPELGFQENHIPAYVEDGAQVGAPRRRARWTRTLRTFSVNYPILTRTQVEALETFWSTTLSEGAKEFNWTHPRKPTGGGMTTVEVRFVQYPTITQVTSNLYAAAVELQEI